jgi:hypothetical protein
MISFRAKVKDLMSSRKFCELPADEATDRIVSLVRELVSVKKNASRATDNQFDYDQKNGWNACVDSILSRLEEK